MDLSAKESGDRGHDWRAPTPEYPDADQIRAYGEFTFLYLRSERHKNDPLWFFRRYLQPPVDLGFFKTFRVDGVARGGMTWAFLGGDAEGKMARAEPLTPSDWASGSQLWIMEIIAPYGHGLGRRIMKEFFTALPAHQSVVRNARYDKNGQLRHIIEFRRTPEGRWNKTRLSVAALTPQISK